MRKTRFLLAILVLPAAAFSASYTVWDFTDGGATHSNSSSYVLWGSVGQATCGKMSSTSYVLNGGYYYGIEEMLSEEQIPKVFSLSQNYPNPFTTVTSIKWAVPKPCHTSLRIYNVAGQVIRTLVNNSQKPGYYTLQWNGRDDKGRKVAPGVYFYRLETEQFKDTKKLVLLW